jgi:glycosyltransferase involved in cell wall biosynthesis
MVCDSLSRMGAGVVESLIYQSQALKDVGVDVGAFGVLDSGFGTGDERWGNVKTTAVQSIGPYSFNYAPGLIAKIAEWNPAVIHAHGIWKYSSIAARRAAERQGIPLVLSPHGMLDPWALRNSAWKKAIVWKLYEGKSMKAVSCMHALSTAELEATRSVGYSGPVVLAPNGVVLPVLDQGANFDPSLFPDRRILLYLGRLHPKKGIEQLLLAVATSRSSLDAPGVGHWNVVIAGDGSKEHVARLRALTTTLRLDDIVHFVGGQYGALRDRWYRRCDAVVLPSVSEGLPMAILEAWSYAKPSIQTPQCNLPEGAIAGAAIVADPERESLSVALLRLVALTDDQRSAMGASGRRLVSERFSWQTYAEKMRDVYQWLAGGGQRPSCVYG